MLTIPAALLEQLGMRVGDTVELFVDRDRLIIDPKQRKHYTLDELLAASDPAALADDKADIFMTSGPVGRELL